MINIIVPVVEDAENFAKFIGENKSKDAVFFVGITENMKKKFSVKGKNIKVFVFKNKSKREEILNSLHSHIVDTGKILIVRRPLTKEEFHSLTTSTKDITTLKAGHNKFVMTIKRIMKILVRKFFAFSFFDDISAICYGESMFQLLRVCPNLSMASRINKYVGLEMEEIETDEKQVKKDFNKSKSIIKLLLGTLFFLGSLAGGILVCIFTPLKALIVILVIFWIFVALIIWFVSLVNFTRTLAVGDLRYGKAEEIA